MPAEEAELLQRTIEDLNRTEDLQKTEFFRVHKLSDAVIAQLKWLESIVDITDTGIYRAKEMNLNRAAYDGAGFLRKRGDSRGAEMSVWLEDAVRAPVGRCEAALL